MWEFMCKYAENFWAGTEYAWEVFEVIMAWAVTLGFAMFVAASIRVLLCSLFNIIKIKTNRGR